MAIWKQEPIAEYNEFIKTFPELSEKFGDLIRTIMEQPNSFTTSTLWQCFILS